jgi:hypothetical protein
MVKSAELWPRETDSDIVKVSSLKTAVPPAFQVSVLKDPELVQVMIPLVLYCDVSPLYVMFAPPPVSEPVQPAPPGVET